MKKQELRYLIREEITRILNEDDSSPEYQAFDKAAKDAINLIFNRHTLSQDTKPFSKDMSTAGAHSINKLYTLPDKVLAKELLDNLVVRWTEYAELMNQTVALKKQNRDGIEQKISALEKEKIDLDIQNQQTQKNTFDETFKDLLEKCKQNYNTLQDKEIVKKLDELFDLVYKNYQSKKYVEATNGAARIVATLFPNMKFTMWANEFTAAKLPNTRTLEILDSYKDMIAKGI